MFRSNKRHLQPALISNINDLPEKRRQRLETSWAGTFRREFFGRIHEEAFAVLYSDVPSRPNVPVNVLVSLDTLKASFGWSDEELCDHFLHDLQVRYALGYENLGVTIRIGISINTATPSHMPFEKCSVPPILATSPLKMRSTSPSRYVSISAAHTPDRMILASSMMYSSIPPPR